MGVDGQGVKSYLTYLATRRQVAAGTQNQAFSALLFLCREVLRLEDPDLETGVRAKDTSRLPVVLTVAETGRLLGAMRGTARLMAEVLYGGGLRVMPFVLRGPGIEPAQRELLFEEFRRGVDAPGQGLGWAWPSPSALPSCWKGACTLSVSRARAACSASM